MGSIINKRTVLTAKAVVEKSFNDPPTLIVLPGRTTPYWTRASQLRKARQIHFLDAGLALVLLDHQLTYHIGIRPIHLATVPTNGSLAHFGEHWGPRWAVFGIPRKPCQRPGDEVAKGRDYVMRVEDGVRDRACPGVGFESREVFCSYANGSFGWGCVGSPVVGRRDGRIEQIGVVIGSTGTEVEEYHVHVKVGPFQEWIKSRMCPG